MADERADADGPLPVSWDEAREVVVIVLVAAAVLHLLSPVVGFIDNRNRFPGSWVDDVSELTRNVGPTAGTLLLGAAILVATTPPADVVPMLRRIVAVVALVAAIGGVLAVVVELTRASPAGVASRLQTVFGRGGPGAMLAITARWLAMRVVPFGD